MCLKKNITLGKASKIFFLLFIFQLFGLSAYSDDVQINKKYAELNILDKVSSKTSSIKIRIGEELIFQNLSINVQNVKILNLMMIPK